MARFNYRNTEKKCKDIGRVLIPSDSPIVITTLTSKLQPLNKPTELFRRNNTSFGSNISWSEPNFYSDLVF